MYLYLIHVGTACGKNNNKKRKTTLTPIRLMQALGNISYIISMYTNYNREPRIILYNQHTDEDC